MSNLLHTFGYQPPENQSAMLAGVQVREAKHTDTLEPLVLLQLRFMMADDLDTATITLMPATDLPEGTVAPEGFAFTEKLDLPMPLEVAEYLIEELTWAVGRAREKHWEGDE